MQSEVPEFSHHSVAIDSLDIKLQLDESDGDIDESIIQDQKDIKE